MVVQSARFLHDVEASEDFDASARSLGSIFGMQTLLQIQIINVYNRRNVWFKNFDFAENPVQQTDVTLLPIIPAISITFNSPK